MRLSVLLAAVSLSVVGLVLADESHASMKQSTHIPPQPLGAALQTLAKDRDFQVVYESAEIAPLRTNGAAGDLTSEEALTQLLSGTGMTYQFYDGNAVSILPVNTKTPRLARIESANSGAPGADQSKGEGKDTSSSFRLVQEAQGVSTGPSPVEKDSDQQASQKKRVELDEVVVTGTHIRGVEDIGSPTITISREEIDQTGYQTMEQLAASLPQNFNGMSPSGQYAPGGNSLNLANYDRSTAIDLRGLGPQSTLTLVNGQRVAGSVAGRVTDISMIPLSMVDHVDIVTGGASAIYGADAVGGVANIVLRQSYDGADTQAYFGGTSFDGDRLQLSQVVGRDYGQAGFVLGYEFARQDQFDLVRANLTAPLSPSGAQNLITPAQPHEHRHSVYLSGHLDATDWIQFHGDASYVHKAQNELSVLNYPAYETLIDNSLIQTNQEHAVNVGARVRLPASWRLDINASNSTYEERYDAAAQIYTAGVPTPQLSSGSFRSTLNSVSAIADGDFLSAFGIQTKAALGVDVRREFLSSNHLPVPATGNIPDGTRTVSAVFGEIHVPLVSDGRVAGLDKLDLSLSARYDHYSDFGHAFDPQAGLVWQPTGDLSFRAEYAKAFRAPDLYSTHVGAITSISAFDLTTPQNPTPTILPTLFAGGGNPALQPEHARTWSSGFDYRIPLTSPVRLSLSYFDITYNSRINTIAGNQGLINSAVYPTNLVNVNPTLAQVQAFAGLGSFAGNFSGFPWDGNFQTILAQLPGLFLLDDRYANISSERLRGMDFSLDTKVATRVGEAIFGINGTRTFTHYQQITSSSPATDVYNKVGYPLGLRLRGNSGLTYGPVGAFIFVNYQGGYADQYQVPYGRIASWTTFDGTVRFDYSRIVPHGPLGNLILSASVQNLFNRRPPLFAENASGILFDAANANPFGRFVSVSVEKRW